MITIRAKSTLKLLSGGMSIDYEYAKGCTINTIARHLALAMVMTHGEEETLKFFETEIKEFEASRIQREAE